MEFQLIQLLRLRFADLRSHCPWQKFATSCQAVGVSCFKKRLKNWHLLGIIFCDRIAKLCQLRFETLGEIFLRISTEGKKGHDLISKVAVLRWTIMLEPPKCNYVQQAGTGCFPPTVTTDLNKQFLIIKVQENAKINNCLMLVGITNFVLKLKKY